MENPTNNCAVADLNHLTNSLCSALIPSSIPRDQWGWASTKLLEAASRLRFIANGFAPINHLPPEILCEVFFHLRPAIRMGPRRSRPPFEDLLTVTHICQHWRRTAIAAPKLWSQLNSRGSNKGLENLTRLFIRRSGQLPLDADVEQPVAIAPYVHRLRTLSCPGSSIQDLPTFLERPAPLLEALHILPHPVFHFTTPLPTLFDGNIPSLRELDMNGFDPFPNNGFRDLSSFRLQLSSGSGDLIFWDSLLEMLRNSPQLEELLLHLGSGYDNIPPADDIPAPAALHALRRLHIRGLTSTLVRRFLNSTDLPRSGIAMQFTDITKFDWMSSSTLPPHLSFHAVTSLEIIYHPSTGFTIQGTNTQMQIRVVETSDSNAMHADIFSRLIMRTDIQHPLRELWIHIGRGTNLRLPSPSKFPRLEKLVVRETTKGGPIYRLLRQLEVVDSRVVCPLLSTLDLSGVVDREFLARVLEARSGAGHRLRMLRLGKGRGLRKDVERLRMWDYVDRLKIFDMNLESRGMELPIVCTTDLGEWWRPWTPERITSAVDGGDFCVGQGILEEMVAHLRAMGEFFP